MVHTTQTYRKNNSVDWNNESTTGVNCTNSSLTIQSLTRALDSAECRHPPRQTWSRYGVYIQSPDPDDSQNL